VRRHCIDGLPNMRVARLWGIARLACSLARARRTLFDVVRATCGGASTFVADEFRFTELVC
jgi:hypothetical protein